MAEEKEKEEKAKAKEDKKEKKKKDKEGKGTDANEEEESTGSKILVGFVTFLIIAIWIGIIGILIKFDVGGIGSSFLTPLLKDVPVINKILPDSDALSNTETENPYDYDSLDEAIARIKELETDLADANSKAKSDSETISELNSEVAELQTYKDDQAEFETLKEKFYEEVVFSDNAPDINEYKTYYESIDPENAEVLYKQVVEQTTYDSEVEEYAAYYSSMKPKNAAAIFDTMTDDLELVAQILQNMSTQSASDILAQMDATNAAKVTEIMNPSK